MEKTEIVKAAMSAGGPAASYGPAQMQKLFFLIDNEIPASVGGPIFNFQPYDYGPFDKEVYETATLLEFTGSVVVDNACQFRQYSLTEAGYQEGQQILAGLDEKARKFIEDASNWVRSVSFQEMVSAIYTHYPDMKKNSIFK